MLHSLIVFHNKLLRRIFGPKMEEVSGCWKRLHCEELHNYFASPNIIRVIESRRLRWAENVPRVGEMRNVHKILVGKPEEKRPVGVRRRR
jgi:hypothetical protein